MVDLLETLRTALAGRYSIERELGRGGMATVYRGEDLKHRRPVAIKVVDPELAAAVGPDRFLREIEIAARLQHPHILSLLDSGMAGALPYYVMPLVEGESLRDRLAREKQLPVAEALRLTGEIAGALDYANASGVTHRDIKPENVLLSGGHAVVADFGVARAIEPAGAARLTETGAVLGTPLYMSPEQAAGGHEVDARSDQYALACVCYEMLAGQPPFTGATSQVVLHQHLTLEPRPVTALRPAVPPSVSAAIARALSKTPADRFASAGEFARAASAVKGDADKYVPQTLAAAGILLLAAAGWFLGEPLLNFLQHVHHPAPAAQKQWVLVADFESTPRDQAIELAARNLVEVALGQSSVAAPVSREQIGLALERAGKPDTARITRELARELAYRSSIKVLVAGEVQRVGDSYAITLRAVDADSGRTLLSMSDRAGKSADFIPCMNRLGNRLRGALGERPGAIAATRPPYETRTTSFEAFRELVAAEEEVRRGNFNDRLAHIRRALVLDPGCAWAWSELAQWHFGGDHENLDSARICQRIALRLSEGASKSERLDLENGLAIFNNDLMGALAIDERLIAEDSSNAGAWADRGYLFARLGRFQAAILSNQESERRSPFGPHPTVLLNDARLMEGIGDAAGARAVVRSLPPGLTRGLTLEIPLVDERWAEAESIAKADLGDSRTAGEFRQYTEDVLRCAAAARGRLGDADRAGGEIPSDSFENLMREVRLRSLQRSLRGLAPAPLPRSLASATTAPALLTKGIWAALGGDLESAKELAIRARSRDADERAGTGRLPELLDARIALRERRSSDVIRALAIPARVGFEGPLTTQGAKQIWMRTAVAEAFEGLSMPDSAAAYFELALIRGGWFLSSDLLARAFVYPLILQRLVMAELRAGQVANARRDFDHLVKSCDEPDAEMSRLIADSRSALLSSEATARSARR